MKKNCNIFLGILLIDVIVDISELKIFILNNI